jgi:hypothetical protein
MRWINNWTMPHALPASVPPGGMGGGNNPSAVPSYTGAGQEGWAKSEFGANSWPSFEGISVQLPKDQWSMAGAAAKERNWNVSRMIDAFFGEDAAVAMHQVGEVQFKRQLYQSLISQQLYLKTTIEAWRTTNIMVSLWWMYNEMWPTGGWGSVEYGAAVPGQILGGRWKPLHFEMRRSTFNDRMATCNTAGACFVANDSPFPFHGSTSIRLLNVVSGVSVPMRLPATGANLSLPVGPKVSAWFCASDPATDAASQPTADAASQPAANAASNTVFQTSAAEAPPPVHATTPYMHVANVIPLNRENFTKQLSHASEPECEAACNSTLGCEGFTYFSWHGLNCAYGALPSLSSKPP